MTRRRTVLKGLAATGATALLGSAAGCTGSLPLGSSDPYSSWLYEPGSVTDADEYAFTYLDTKTVRENEDEFDATAVDLYGLLLEGDLEDSGIDLDDVDRVVSPPAGTVFQGSFDLDDVTEALSDEELGVATERAGFDLVDAQL